RCWLVQSPCLGERKPLQILGLGCEFHEIELNGNCPLAMQHVGMTIPTVPTALPKIDRPPEPDGQLYLPISGEIKIGTEGCCFKPTGYPERRSAGWQTFGESPGASKPCLEGIIFDDQLSFGINEFYGASGRLTGAGIVDSNSKLRLLRERSSEDAQKNQKDNSAIHCESFSQSGD